jgi:ribosomal protein S1
MAGLFEASSQAMVVPYEGQILTGVVVARGKDEILVDVGAKSEAVVTRKEMMRGQEAPKVGDSVMVYVVEPETESGELVCSLSKARVESVWQDLNRAQSEGTIVEVEVRDHNKGGLVINAEGIRGFLPAGQAGREVGELQQLVGKKLLVKVVESSKSKGRLVVSHKAVEEEERAKARADLLGKIAVGDELEGIITGTPTYGAFVNFGEADGLIHISEIAWERVERVEDKLAVGDKVTVKVIKLDPVTHRISLSLRQMSPDPWTVRASTLQEGDVVEGTVSRVKRYGIFIELAKGVEGLLHVSELGDLGEKPEEVAAPGDKIQVRVLSVDPVTRRITFSLASSKVEAEESAEISEEPEELVLNGTGAGKSIDAKNSILGQINPGGEVEGLDSENDADAIPSEGEGGASQSQGDGPS